MKDLNKTIEFDFQSNAISYCRFDSSTIGFGVVSYMLAIMEWPFGETATKLHYSYSTGLSSENGNDTDIVSQLLSIYQLRNPNDNSTDELYNQALIKFFNDYGFFKRQDKCEIITINREDIDSFLRLIFIINDIYNEINSPSPLPEKSCMKLLNYIMELTFLNFNDYRFELRPFPINHYLEPSDQQFDPDNELMYAIKNVPIAYRNQISDYNCNEKYDVEKLILQLHDLLSKRLSPKDMTVIDFFYNHINNQDFKILTSDKDGLYSLSIIDFPYEQCEKEVITIADHLCNYFLSQACKNSTFVVNTTLKNGNYVRELRYNVADLADAVLLSLLFFDPTRQEFRRCSLPNCTNYFLTNRSNMKKMYCCRSHTRTAATHRFREKQ